MSIKLDDLIPRSKTHYKATSIDEINELSLAVGDTVCITDVNTLKDVYYTVTDSKTMDIHTSSLPINNNLFLRKHNAISIGSEAPTSAEGVDGDIALII